MKLSKIHVNTWIGAICIVFAVIFYMMTGQFINPDAAIWPRVILVGIIIMSVMLVINGLGQSKMGAESGAIPAELLKGPLACVIAVVLYAIVMNFTGYFVSTAIFLPLGMYALGQRNWKAILGVTIGLEVFIYILFVTQLQLRMP